MQSLAIEELLKLIDIQRLQPLVVDVGASDGYYNSNSYDLISQYGWRGILFDPQEDKLEIAKQHHKDRLDRVRFEDCAISEHDDVLVLYGHKNDGNGSHTMNHGASLLPLRDSPVQRPAKSISYKTFTSIVNLEAVGVLSIDTEGYDTNILYGLFQATTQRPQVIVTERYYPFDSKQHLDKIKLLSNEYDCRHDGLDQIWIRKDVSVCKTIE